jgi:hypothetical protein
VKEFNLGETEVFEVWFIPTNPEHYSGFIPTNPEHYSVYIMQTYLSLVSAQEYIEAMKPKMRGTMEVVRLRIVRQLMEVAQ